MIDRVCSYADRGWDRLVVRLQAHEIALDGVADVGKGLAVLILLDDDPEFHECDRITPAGRGSEAA